MATNNTKFKQNIVTTMLVLLCFQITLVSSQDIPNYCELGKCKSCADMGEAVECVICVNSFSSSATAAKTGAHCDSTGWDANCYYGSSSNGTKACQQCKENYKLTFQNGVMTCVANTVANCLKQVDSNSSVQCNECKNSMAPSQDFSQCETPAQIVEGCVNYQRVTTPTGTKVECSKCGSTKVLNTDNQSCVERISSQVGCTHMSQNACTRCDTENMYYATSQIATGVVCTIGTASTTPATSGSNDNDHCKAGSCVVCEKVGEIKHCRGCMNSINILEGFNVVKCDTETAMPENCLSAIQGNSLMCFVCKEGYSLKNNACESNFIEDCKLQSWVTDAHTCSVCKNKKQPSTDKKTCIASTLNIENCIYYGTNEAGNGVECVQCSAGNYLKHEDKKCYADSQFSGCQEVKENKCASCDYVNSKWATDHSATKGSICSSGFRIYSVLGLLATAVFVLTIKF